MVVPAVKAGFGSHVSVSKVRSRSQWVKNLEADSKASVWVGRKRDGTAAIETGPLNLASLALASGS